MNRLLAEITPPALRSTGVLAAPSRTVTDPTKLSVVPPANATNVQSSAVDAAWADDTTKNIFAVGAFDSKTYAASGMQSGYAELFNVPIGSGTDTVVVGYLASLYQTADAASARVSDTVTHLTFDKKFTDTSCGNGCHSFGIATHDSTDNRDYDLIYTTFSADNVVAELAFLAPADAVTANTQTFSDLVGNVFAAVYQTVSNGGQAVGIEDVELTHKVKGKTKITHTLKVKEKGTFAALVIDAIGSSPSVAITVSRGARVAGTITLTNLGKQTDGSYLYAGSSKFKKTGSYTAQLAVQDGSATATQSLTFKVKK